MSTRDFKAAQGVQRRSITAELRTTGDEMALVGRAASFNSLSKDLGGFREKIAPSAFSRSLRAGADVKFLVNHDPNHILGRTKSGTLQLSADSDGLNFRCHLNKDSQYHRDIYAAVKRGDLTECSFAFTVPKGGDSWADGTDPDSGARCAFRTLTDVDLVDASLVTYPAYNETNASARSLPDYGSAQRFGYSRKVSVDDNYRIEIMRKAARAMLAPQRREAGLNQEAFDLIGAHLQRCHEMAEDLFAGSGTLEDVYGDDQHGDDFWNDGWNDDTGDDEDGYERSYRQAARSFRDSLRKMRAHANLAARRLAAMRLHHSKLADALGRKK